jgi:hypothetical protein
MTALSSLIYSSAGKEDVDQSSATKKQDTKHIHCPIGIVVLKIARSILDVTQPSSELCTTSTSDVRCLREPTLPFTVRARTVKA